MKPWIAFFLTCSLYGCLGSSSTSPQAAAKQITVTKLGWEFQNCPSDYNADFSLSLSTSIHYVGANLIRSDIDSATFAPVGMTWNWNLLLTSSEFNDSAKTIGYGWKNCYTYQYSPNGSVMPIGPYKFSVVLNGGDRVADTLVVPAPGNTSTLGFQYLYTEDYTGQVTGAFIPMLHRPTISSASRGGDTITVAFSIKDTLAYGGWLWFYDDTGAYIGISEYFRNYTTKAMSGTINGASGLAVDGTLNSVKVLAENCTMNTNFSFTQIAKVRVVVTDGRQYANTTQDFDCRSISPQVSIN
jgi:hypothetical protein